MPWIRIAALMRGIAKLRKPQDGRAADLTTGPTPVEQAELANIPARGFDHAPVGIQAWLKDKR